MATTNAKKNTTTTTKSSGANNKSSSRTAGTKVSAVVEDTIITQPTVEETVQTTNVVDEVVTETASPMETVRSSQAPIIYKAKEKIPMDALVPVTNILGGELTYVSKATVGYVETWEGYGSVAYMTMFELTKLAQTDRRFFTENWISVDISVLRDLGVEKYYKELITPEYIDELFTKAPETIVDKINKMSPALKNSVGLRAEQMIADGQLIDFRIITAIERALNCELYER